MTITTLTRSVLAAGLAGSTMLLSACGSDASADSSASGEGASSDAITIRAIDYAYLDVPEQVSAGSRLALTNASGAEAHEIVAIRLADDETRTAAELARLPEAELGPLFADVRTVVLAAPEADGTAVVGDGTLDEAGRYLLLCMIPTDADPEEYITKAATSDGPPDVAGGPPHIAQGMFADIEVVD